MHHSNNLTPSFFIQERRPFATSQAQLLFRACSLLDRLGYSTDFTLDPEWSRVEIFEFPVVHLDAADDANSEDCGEGARQAC